MCLCPARNGDKQMTVLLYRLPITRAISSELNLGTTPALLDAPAEGYFYLMPIQRFVHQKHRELANQVLKELSNVNHEHGTTRGYRQGCIGPLCRRANRDECRAYIQRKLNRQSRRSVNKPHYESVEPLLSELQQYAKQVQTTST